MQCVSAKELKKKKENTYCHINRVSALEWQKKGTGKKPLHFQSGICVLLDILEAKNKTE